MNESNFATLDLNDLHWIIRRLPATVRDELKARGPSLILAGGFIRAVIANETVNDVDLFVPSVEVGKSVATVIAEGNQKRIHATQNALTVFGQKYTVQIITRWTYQRAADIVPSFDFTVARAAVWWEDEKWQSLIAGTFYADLAAKRLIYCNPDRNEDAGGSMLRVLKFYQRGYRIPLPSLGAVMARLLRGVDEESTLFWTGRNSDGKAPDNPEVDAYRAKILTGLLREVDPNVDPDHITHLPSLPEEKPE